MEAAVTVSSATLIEEAGISYRQLDYWVRHKIITPERAASGSGSSRRFTRDQVELATWIGRLTRAGFDLRLARETAVNLIEDGESYLDFPDCVVHLVYEQEAQS